jgi:hypothetical protein
MEIFSENAECREEHDANAAKQGGDADAAMVRSTTQM